MTDAGGTWSDERVALLKKLWEEGRSASQIAAEIGGVSRNAVIGKVHRLGLSGRIKAGSSATAKSRAKPAAAPRPRDVASPAVADGERANAGPIARKPAPKVEPAAPRSFAQAMQGRVETRAPREPARAEGEHVTIMDLREGMCRWPLGDPTSPDFRFCGAGAHIGMPYCQHHAQIAYQPSADRRRDRKAANG